MAFLTIAFLWLFSLSVVSGVGFVLALFSVYRLNGGKRSFLSWFKAMQF